MSKLLVLDAGHGGHDPGAVANGLKEKDLTLDITKRIKKYLDDNYNGVKVHLTRTTDKYLSLADRYNFANRLNADLFVSIHINAGGGTGYESFIHSNLSDTSKTARMRNNVHSEAIKKMKVTDRGRKKANFAVLRNTKMPAILPENLFIDRKKDAARLKKSSELQKIAEGHAIGIAKALGLSKKTKTPKKETNTGKNNTNTSKKETNTKEDKSQAGKWVKSIYRGKDGLNFYSTPRWSSPTGTFRYGQGWTIISKIKVGNGHQYKVKNSKGAIYYITASKKYVTVT